MGNSLTTSLDTISNSIYCNGCICQTSIPPTIQIQTDLNYYSHLFSNFEFITFNYKGDVQYYNTNSLKLLTSGILPVVVYPSVSPLDQQNKWPLFCLTTNGVGTLSMDINPNIPDNGGKCPNDWIDLSSIINNTLSKYNYEDYGDGSLLPRSDYITSSVIHHPRKTVSLFCALYHKIRPIEYILKIDVTDELSFYIIAIENGN